MRTHFNFLKTCPILFKSGSHLSGKTVISLRFFIIFKAFLKCVSAEGKLKSDCYRNVRKCYSRKEL